MKKVMKAMPKEKMKTYPSAAAAVKAAQKRGDKGIIVKFTKPQKSKK